MPAWVTSERQAALQRLWARTGCRCLQGHWTCADLSHYVHTVTRAVTALPVIVLREWPESDRAAQDVERYELGRPFSIPVQEMDTLWDVESRNLINSWKADDRDGERYGRYVQSHQLHHIYELLRDKRGRWDETARVDWVENKRPDFYLEALGICSVRRVPIAKVRIPSTYVHLYINVGGAFKGMGKNKRRKALRYGGAPPADVERRIMALCKLAVQDYIAKH